MEQLSRRSFTAAAAGALAAAALPAVPADAAEEPVAAPDGRATPDGPPPGRPRPHRQMRGMWIASVANTNWPSAPGLSADRQRQELLDLLDLAVERRLNAVMLQVRPTADAFWPSPTSRGRST